MDEYPAGLQVVLCQFFLGTPGGKAASGEYRVECERKFGFAGSAWAMQRVTKPWSRLVGGWMKISLPYTDQAGLTGDAGAPLAPLQPAFKFSFRPTNDSEFGGVRFHQLPLSLGAGPINIKDLVDLGGWPNQTVVVTPPGSGTTTYEPVVIGGSTYYRQVTT